MQRAKLDIEDALAELIATHEVRAACLCVARAVLKLHCIASVHSCPHPPIDQSHAPLVSEVLIHRGAIQDNGNGVFW